MKRLSALLAATIAALCTISAEESSTVLLSTMSARLSAMAPYRIEFEVSAPDAGSSRGSMVVDSMRYSIEIEGERLFSDGRLRYGISAAEQTVTIDAVDPYNRNLLENPAEGFNFDAALFGSTILSRDQKSIVMELVPAAGVLDAVDRVELIISSETLLPRRIAYDIGGTILTIDILNIGHVVLPAESFIFKPADYKDYDVVSFVD